MDNQAYLDQIAVKGKVKSGPVLTPKLIKLIVVGLIVLVTMIIVGTVLSESNNKVQYSYERVYLRANWLSDDESPIRTYMDRVKDSNLRSYAMTLLTSLRNTSLAIENIQSSININTEKPTAKIADQEGGDIDDFEDLLKNAVLTGTVDQTFATQVYYQVTVLLNNEKAARAKTPSRKFAEVLDQSIDDLTIIQTQFKNYNEAKEAE
jgi:hypothetical protein